MDQVLLGLQGTELFAHKDDTTVCVDDLEDHGMKGRRHLKQLIEDNLSIHPENCDFFKETAYIGLTISKKVVKPDPKEGEVKISLD